MLQIDSIVTDLMFQASAAIDQQTLIDGLGGEEVLQTKQLLDVDRLDPRAEMELSPSMPFRRRGERRLMIIDDQATTPRPDPAADPFIKADLRPFKEALITMVQKLPVRLGRIFALGGWGDAVIVAKDVRDLRGIALIAYALDPQVDVDGKRRQTPLSQKEFEAKLLAYEKRLEELDEQQILARLSGVSFERRGDVVVVDILEPDGTWDQRKSMMMEQQLAAMDAFSMIPGAPSTTAKREPAPAAAPGGGGGGYTINAKPGPFTAAPKPAEKKPEPPSKPVEAKPEPKAEPKGPPLSVKEIDGKVLLVFPPERFDLDVAAALGKRDWDNVVRATDNVPGALRDKIHRDGATWVAPLEFLSEVFIDGKPLTKQQFEKDAHSIAEGGRALEVHFPRFGEVVLLDIPGKGRFVTSLTDRAEQVASLVK